MLIALTIAWRNLFRHKGKSIIIGLILGFGAFIMTVGNGVISGLDNGLQENIVENFSGDIVLMSDKQLEQTVLVSMTGQTLKPIVDAEDLLPKILNFDRISDVLPVGVGYVWVHNENGNPLDQYLIGVDIDAYLKFFNNNLIVQEGHMMEPSERGVLISTKMRDWYFDFSDTWVVPYRTSFNMNEAPEKVIKQKESVSIKTSMVYMGLSSKNASLDILSPVLGIVRFKELNSILGFYCIVDMASFRECMGYYTSNSAPVTLSKSDQSLIALETENFDDFFSDNVVSMGDSSGFLSDEIASFKESSPVVIEQNMGTYNLIFAKLKPGFDLNQSVDQLNAFLKEHKIPLTAVTWSRAIGMFGQIAMLMKGALFLFVLFIFIVAIIIIMNTLSMAMLERSPEIGMMRAIGAKRRFIQAMCIFETGVLSIVFGGIGIGLGAITIIILQRLNLTTDHEMLQIFYGGDTFAPILDVSGITLCLVQLGLITILSSIYPILVARKITPLDAVVKE